MIGRQMVGRIHSRLAQAKAGRNASEYSLGGVSCVAVGDPAQCEAIMDQQIYDVKPHKETADESDKRSVQLSNRGLSVYSEFVKVIILTKTHRLTKIEDPQTPEDHASNERAERFVKVLRRLRDLEWTPEDYYWLCERKRSKLTLQQRQEFANAPVLMDFRKTTDTNPEDNCEFFNKAHLRQMVRQKKSSTRQYHSVAQWRSWRPGQKARRGTLQWPRSGAGDRRGRTCHSHQQSGGRARTHEWYAGRGAAYSLQSVSYTHLTLPTNREV